jgi:hypothetical protein
MKVRDVKAEAAAAAAMEAEKNVPEELKRKGRSSRSTGVKRDICRQIFDSLPLDTSY